VCKRVSSSGTFFEQGGADDLKEKSSSPFDKPEDNGNGQNGLDQSENGFG
jgi:hypothetical protein